MKLVLTCRSCTGDEEKVVCNATRKEAEEAAKLIMKKRKKWYAVSIQGVNGGATHTVYSAGAIGG